MTDRTVRWAGAAGIFFVVLVLVTVFASGAPPAADDAVDKIRAYFVDHRNALLISNFIGLVATPFALWFAVVLRDVVRGDRTSNALGTAALAGLIMTAATIAAGGALQASPVYVNGVAAKLGDDSLRIIFEAQVLAFSAASSGLILFGIGVALAIRRTNALPGYLMWLALLCALGNFVALFSFLGAGAAVLGLPGVLTFALFVLVTGITMALGKVRPAAAEPVPAV